MHTLAGLKMPNHIAIRFVWGARAENPQQISEHVLQMTDGLDKLDPFFQSWWFIDKYIGREYVPLRRVRSRMASLFDYAVMRDDFGYPEPYYGCACTMATICVSRILPLLKYGPASNKS